MIFLMEKELKYSLMDQNIRDNFKIADLKVMEHFNGQMVEFLKEIGSIIKLMDKDN